MASARSRTAAPTIRRLRSERPTDLSWWRNDWTLRPYDESDSDPWSHRPFLRLLEPAVIIARKRMHSLTLDLVPGSYAICRWPPGEPLPHWVMQGEFFSVTRTPAELSAVCDVAALPP